MATFDLEEQEKLDELKAWWKTNGKLVTAVIVAAVLGMAGWQVWQSWQSKQQAEAAAMFSLMQQASDQGALKDMREIAGKLMDKYDSTGFATRAALMVARANHAAQDDKSAEAQLQWVIDHSTEAGLRDLARLDLAAVLLDEKQADAALKVLDQPHDTALDALYLDRRGDVFVALGKKAEAARAYDAALQKVDANQPYSRVIQIKRDALGSQA